MTSSHLDKFPKYKGLSVALSIYPAQLEAIKTLELFPDDAWIVTYPKSGTTWMQHIVNLVRNRGEDDGRNLSVAVPWIGANNPDTYKVDISSLKSPRAFKSHLPYDLMPCGLPKDTPCKYIYVARNPKDVAVSYYHHSLGYEYFEDANWDTYVDWFLAGEVPYGDYSDHLLSWWNHKDDKNVLFIKYEDLKKDLFTGVMLVSKFLDVSISSEEAECVVKKCTFSSMKDNPETNHSWDSHVRSRHAAPFMRKGIVGDWKEYFSLEQSERCDELYVKKLQLAGLTFAFD